MKEDTDTRQSAQPQPHPSPTSHQEVSEALIAAYDEEFELFAQNPQVRMALRESISGKVKRRTLMRLGFVGGCKAGGVAAGYMYRVELARALGLDGDLAEYLPEWDELMDEVRRLRGAGPRPEANLAVEDLLDDPDATPEARPPRGRP